MVISAMEPVTEKPAWLDLSCGASAEMVLGALVDAGVPFDVVTSAAASTGLPVVLQHVPCRRGGRNATWVIASTTAPQPVPSDGEPVTETVQVAAVRAAVTWLREQGQLTSLQAWPEVDSGLARALVDGWEPMPADQVGLTALGAGSVEVSDHPHGVKLVLAP